MATTIGLQIAFCSPVSCSVHQFCQGYLSSVSLLSLYSSLLLKVVSCWLSSILPSSAHFPQTYTLYFMLRQQHWVPESMRTHTHTHTHTRTHTHSHNTFSPLAFANTVLLEPLSFHMYMSDATYPLNQLKGTFHESLSLTLQARSERSSPQLYPFCRIYAFLFIWLLIMYMANYLLWSLFSKVFHNKISHLSYSFTIWPWFSLNERQRFGLFFFFFSFIFLWMVPRLVIILTKEGCGNDVLEYPSPGIKREWQLLLFCSDKSQLLCRRAN